MQKLLRYASTGYHKIEPIIIGDSVSGQSLLLAFVTSSKNHSKKIAGFVIDAEIVCDRHSSIRQNLFRQQEKNFSLQYSIAVVSKLCFLRLPFEISELRQEKELWLLPDYRIGIRLKGTSIEDIVKTRTKRNLMLIFLLDILLISAIWLVYRTLKKEMELVRLKGDFVSNVSHELRTPLSLIRMFTETLSMKRVITEERKQEYYTTILHETERLTRLINNILNFSRMEAGKKQYHFATANLNEVVNEVMKTYQSHLQHEGFETAIELMEIIPSVYVDGEAVTEALINILDNAVKYSGTEKFVRLGTGVSGKMIYMGLADEHPDSIDDGILYSNPNSPASIGIGPFTEMPSSLHSGSCGIAFADGHAEIHKWVDPRTTPPVTFSVLHNVSMTSPNQDLMWISLHTPRASN